MTSRPAPATDPEPAARGNGRIMHRDPAVTEKIDGVTRVKVTEHILEHASITSRPDGSASVQASLSASFAGEAVVSALDQSNASLMGDAPACDVCGSITVRNGSCYKCMNCGNSMGCS